ncbi:MAG: membrane protein insertion efficiency factor YidD [Pedosphaera sp.]|nr:membrane protein insertion efficiency factor YidD [Pedosphaera sp.]
MRSLLLSAIRLYWAFWPRCWNRGCLYRETCSHYVHRVCSNHGFRAGVRALRDRVRTCRPGYGVTSNGSCIGLLLSDGSFLPGHLVAKDVLAPIRHSIAEFEECLHDGNRDG